MNWFLAHRGWTMATAVVLVVLIAVVWIWT
jgi:hypothetical protein